MKIIIKALVATLLVVGPMGAQADIITVSGAGDADGQWEIDLIETSFNESEELLTSQVWWGGDGEGTIAEIFAIAFGYQAENTFGLLGPFFAFDTVDRSCCWGWVQWTEAEVRSVTEWGDVHDGEVFLDRSATFAIASRVASVPEPGTLLLLGAGLFGLGISRRVRRS